MWLLPEAKHEWGRLSAELVRLRLLTVVDRAAFAVYCQTWAHYVRLANSSEPGDVRLTLKLLEKLSLFGGKFGLSPSDRARLAVVPPTKADEFERFLAGDDGAASGS